MAAPLPGIQFRPLEGLRILSFELAVSLPAGTRILADFGAEVVQVHRPRPQDDAFIIVNYDGSLLSKSSVALDLTRAGARDVALRLAAGADVVCTNFRPGVMARFGLDYEALRAVRPDQIVLQLSGYGTPGPWASFPAFGHSVEAAAGMNSLIGDPDGPPMQVGSRVLADQLAGKYAALALLGALIHRRRTCKGQYIDLSMYEAIVHVLGELVLQTSERRVPPTRTGNRDPKLAPQGIYPCLPSMHDDEWVALTVASDGEWTALRTLLHDPRLDSGVYDSLEGRVRGHDELDLVIGDWTRPRPKDEAAALLQSRGIAAGPVQRPSNIALDPQHAHRRFFQQVRHERPVLGYAAHPHPSLAVRVEGFDRPTPADSHRAGTDNRRILRSWGGYGEAEIDALERDGVIVPPGGDGREAAAPSGAGAGGAPGFVDPDFARKLGLPVDPVARR